MLPNIVGSPPMVSATDLKSVASKVTEKDFKGVSNPDSSFGKALKDKLSSKDPKEMKESPKQQEAKAQDQKESKTKTQDDQPQGKPEEKAETQKVDKPEGKLVKKATARQKAIKEFMDSFESEFEIPPTRLVDAMAQLDDAQLKESPEKTADAVIDQLDLDDAQADKARAMYVALLTQLQQNQMQPQKPTPEMTTGFGLSAQNTQMRIAAAQEKQNMLGSAVENLNKKFWSNPQAKPLASNALPGLDASIAQKISMDDEMLGGSDAFADMAEAAPAIESQLPQMPSSKMDQLPPHLQGQMKETVSPALLAALAAKKAQAAAEQANAMGAEGAEEGTELSDEFAQALQAPQGEKPQAQNFEKGAIADTKQSAQDFFQQNQSQQSMMDSKEFSQQSMGQDKEAAKGKLTTKAADFKSALTGMEGMQPTPLKADALRFDATAAPAPLAASGQHPAENDAAVKQLLNQAQYLIKKGGGEVNVQMTPEGMGKIQLKVMLQDGKVNLQMSADTQEAKKTIESSLVDLKNSLAAHKLSVDNVKIDVVNSTSSDTATNNQSQSNMNGHSQRDNRQFWNQFNDNFGNQARREAFTDLQNVKGYGPRRNPLQPIESASANASARQVDGKGSGINLVA